MLAGHLLPEDLPTRSATQVKNAWADVVRLVHQEGGVAVTNRSNVEMVLIHATTYKKILATLETVRTEQQERLDALDRAFSERLKVLQDPSAAARVQAVMASKGKLKHPVKVGSGL